MKNTLTKKLLIVFTALLLVGVITLCIACNNDPYAGNYKEVSAEEREEFVAGAIERIQKIEEDGGLGNVKMTYTVSTTQEYINGKMTGEIEVSLVMDGEKLLAELNVSTKEEYKPTLSEKIEEISTNISGKVWIDNETEEIYYQLTKNDEKLEGKYAGEKEVIGAINEVKQAYDILTSAAKMIENFLMEEQATIYADGNNFKIVEESEETALEVYFIFEKDDAFRCKVAMTSSSEHDGMKSEYKYVVEIVTSSETVTIPTDIK